MKSDAGSTLMDSFVKSFKSWEEQGTNYNPGVHIIRTYQLSTHQGLPYSLHARVDV